MNSKNFSKRGQFGFTIVEALISLIIMGFGVMSLSGMQIFLSRNADDAKQRTEAVRLAQEKIEFFRSYTGIATTLIGQATASGTALNWNALANGSDTITTNAVYTRSWTIGGATSDPMRNLTVAVDWTDRAGQTQAVSLSTVLSKTDPADSGFLGFPLPENTNLKRPKNRNLNIPIPAIDIGNGKSAVAFGSGNYVLFSNISGDVVQICSPTLGGAPSTADIIAALNIAANCTTVNGYIVAGYVTRDTSVSIAEWNAVKAGLGINYSDITRNAAGTSGINCQFGDAINPSSGAIIDNVKYYLCVIPLAEPTPALTAHGPYNWSGTIRIAGPSVWHGSGNKYYVCRFQYTATSDLTATNERNVQPYVDVNKSIDQQNYLVATTANATSGAAPACPGSMTVAGVSTGVLHQDCRSASNSAGYTSACPLLGALPTFTLTYNGNTNTSGTAPIDTNSPYTADSITTVLGNTGNLAKTSNTFNGWNTVANGTGTAYAAGTSITISTNTTLYAQWTTLQSYTVTYNGNTNTSGTAPTDANSPYASGSTITVLGNTGSMAKTGYTFSGWNTAADGNGTVYSAGSTLSLAANTTLYAQWVVLPTFIVTYNGNGNTSGSVPVDGNSYISGSLVTVKANSGTLEKLGYGFNGWNTAANGSGTNYSPNASFNIASNTTLYAKWLQLKLGTPIPTWNGTDPKSLGWPSVNGAIAYSVSSCSVINSGSQTSCTPAGPANQSANIVTPPSLGTKDTWCYSIIATGSPYLPSNSSGSKCIIRAANGNYSYQ